MDTERVIEDWKRMYVSGRWNLQTFEQHLEAMLPVLFEDAAQTMREDVSATRRAERF